jgi:uncharacterized protein YfdQ (DUF2303 family)
MIDKEAREYLLGVIQVNHVNGFLTDNENSDSFQLAIPDNYKIVDTEQYEQNPNRFRADFSTQFIAEFIGYVKNFADEKTAVFIDTKSFTASAIVDFGAVGEPLWAEHKATLNLGKQPEYVALTHAMDKLHGQVGFADFMEDNVECLVFLDAAKQPIDFGKVLTGIRKLTTSSISESTTEVTDTKFSASAFDEIEVKSKDNKLPAGFSFTCVPVDGLSAYDFNCRLRFIAENGTPKIKYRIVGMEQKLQLMGQEFRTLIQEGLGKDIPVYVGCMATKYE